MGYCCVPLCKNCHSKRRDLSFYRFPKDDKILRKWLKAIRRENWTPGENSRICSWHFPEGREKGPSLFDWNIKKQFRYSEPELKRKRHKLNQEETSGLTADVTSMEVHRCEAMEQMETEIDRLKTEVQLLKFGMRFNHICNNEDLISMYTGLRKVAFCAAAHVLKRFSLTYYAGWSVQNVAMEDQLLMTLMKLRLNMPMMDLAVRFDISRTSCTNIFMTILSALHEIFFKAGMRKIPSVKKTRACLPECFSSFGSCRQVWDCTEVEIEVPRKNLNAQRMTYSSYKSKNTFKALVSVSPNGAIIFCSDLYSGNTSDKEIVIRSGILNTCETGDMILADKGFLIHDILPPGVTLNMPAFLPQINRQFSEQQVVQNRAIARARIHVERAIQRMKEFNILDCIDNHHRNNANVILQVVAAMVNLQSFIIASQSSS